jgi:hypothetical protein
MTSTSETKVTTVAQPREGKPECALPPREQEQPQPEKKVRTTPPYIQTVCTQEQFDLHQQRRKELNETWSQYILAGLELRLAQLAKREQWREQKRRQAQSKTSQPVEAKGG